MMTRLPDDAQILLGTLVSRRGVWIPLLLLLTTWCGPSVAGAALVPSEAEASAPPGLEDDGPGVLSGEIEPDSLESAVAPDELERIKARLRDLYTSLYRDTSSMLNAPEGAVRDSLELELEKLHKEIDILRSELEKGKGERALQQQNWRELESDIRRAARQGDTESFDAELERFLALLSEVGGEIQQQIGHVQLEISADRFRLATEGGGYIDVRIPEEVRENLKNGVITFNQQLGQVLSDSMLQELGRNLEKYTHDSGLNLGLLGRLQKKPKHKKWRVIGSSIFKTGPSFTVNDDELVKGDVVLVGGSLVIEGKVLGKVVCLGGDIEVGPEGVIEGDAVSLGGDVVQQEGASVQGRVVDVGRLVPSVAGMKRTASYLTLLMLTLRLLVLAVLAMIVLALMGSRMSLMCDHCARGLTQPFLEGVLWLSVAVALFLVASVTLALTIIGIPVALLVAVVFGALLLSAYLITCRLIGERILRLFFRDLRVVEWRSVLAGLIALELPALILTAFALISANDGAELALPRNIDLAIKFLALSLGFGCVMRSRFGSTRPASPAQAATASAQTPS